LSTLSEAIAAIKEVIKLTHDVKRAGETLKELSKELREHDRRITRLEAQWETALRLSTGRGLNQLEGKQQG
jgi:predicted  nucleic acid-binding Zn-ribbon protein